MGSVAGEGRLRTFSKFSFAHSHAFAQFSITIAHTTYVNKVLRLRALKKLYVNSTSSVSQI